MPFKFKLKFTISLWKKSSTYVDPGFAVEKM